MTTLNKCLVETKYAENAETTQYTATTRTIIDKVTAFSAAGGTIAIKLVPNGGSAGASNLVVTKTLAANESYTFPEVVGHTLNAGDFISALAGAANTVVIRISGREIT
jgi:hypothetical protein